MLRRSELTRRFRRPTRSILYRDVRVGGDSPITIQSMTTVPASDIRRTMHEIRALVRAGCELVRVAVKDDSDVSALARITSLSPIPVIADVHFDYRLAVKAAEAGADGLRINPGNIGGPDRVKQVVEAAGRASIPIRIGVNSGSIERDLGALARKNPARALFESARRAKKLVEAMGFEKLVFSLKSPDPMVTVEANRLFAADNDFPLHLGVTEAGPVLSGSARSAVALTMLLSEGIGDTVRVSLSGDPVNEVIVAAAVLSALGLREDIPRIVSCPTCGRARIDVAKIAEALERELSGVRAGITIAVMGCEVNGPGEARDADIGIAGARGGAMLFKEGKIFERLRRDYRKRFVEHVRNFLRIKEK